MLYFVSMNNDFENKFIGNIDKKPAYKELFDLLSEDGFDKKHFAITCIEYLEKPEDIEHLIKNLVDQDTKIREITSFKVYDFIKEDNNLMKFLDKHAEITLRTANDVNPQVCRNITKLLPLSEKKDYFAQKFLEKVDECIKETLSIKAKSHKVNKVIFNLYWNLFAIEFLIDNDFKHAQTLIKAIKQTQRYKDYTIRERSAFLIKKLSEHGFDTEDFIEKFKADENFYVKNVFAS